MVLHPLHKKYKIKRVVITTFQSVSGAGTAGINQLYAERNNNALNVHTGIFPTQIDMNCIPQCDKIDAITAYTGEEIKLQLETPKILNDDIKLTATAVRVPVIGGHSESVNIEFYNEFEIEDINQILSDSSGIFIKDLACPADVQDEEDVWVSRIRRDFSQEKTINLWIVADNLMKGAALNAVQIGEILSKV
jgi:aspartate-semialdehyde dehydrogenase